jgi:hypothetical protein
MSPKSNFFFSNNFIWAKMNADSFCPRLSPAESISGGQKGASARDELQDPPTPLVSAFFLFIQGF